MELISGCWNSEAEEKFPTPEKTFTKDAVEKSSRSSLPIHLIKSSQRQQFPAKDENWKVNPSRMVLLFLFLPTKTPFILSLGQKRAKKSQGKKFLLPKYELRGAASKITDHSAYRVDGFRFFISEK